MVQMQQDEQYPGESYLMLFPMIDFDTSYPSCIYTIMQFVTSQAKQYDATSILTFDQPLYWKALTCIQSRTVGRDLKRKLMLSDICWLAMLSP